MEKFSLEYGQIHCKVKFWNQFVAEKQKHNWIMKVAYYPKINQKLNNIQSC